MLRKLKTNLTKEDLIRPSLNLDAANQAMHNQPSSAGGLVLPLQNKVTEALAKPSAPVSDDWKRQGDPSAPAIKELEAIKLFERQQAEAAAAAAARAAPAPVAAPAPSVPDSLAIGAPAQVVAPQDPNLPYPEAVAKASFQPGGLPEKDWNPVTPGMEAYDMPDMWSKPLPPTSPLSPDYKPAARPGPAVASTAPAPQAPLVMDELAAQPIATPTASGIQEMPNEGVVYIPHDPSKTIVSATTIPSSATAAGSTNSAVSPENSFASGGYAIIPHDSNPLVSVPSGGNKQYKSVMDP